MNEKASAGPYFSTVLAAIFLEFILFLSGRVLLWQRRTWAPGESGARIVCLGDSHTLGVGTAAAYAYLQQLEKLLNRNNPAVNFSVVNLGVPGSSTKDQVRILEAFFEKNNARAMFWLTGRNIKEDLKRWDGSEGARSAGFSLDRLRSVRFLGLALRRFFGKNRASELEGVSPADAQKRAAYFNYYLERGRGLCRAKGAKLVLLSYYNSSSPALKNFALEHGVPFFDFTDAFKVFPRGWRDAFFISPDRSHMNRFGYKYNAEQLYVALFLHAQALGLKINPPTQKAEGQFYASEQEKQAMIVLQEARVVQSKGSWRYAFEWVHLGHIYGEMGDEVSALRCYKKGLIASEYVNNNSIVSPIVNWYLQGGGRNDEALHVCEEILAHNPANGIAQNYRDQLTKRTPQTSGKG